MNRILYSLAYLILLGIPAGVLMYLTADNIDFPAVLLVILITLVVGGIFDIWAVRQGENDEFFIWEYNSKSILGFKIFGVPIEDYVFFLVLTPLFIISIYEGVKVLLTNTGLTGPITISAIVLLFSYYLVYRHAIHPKKN